MVANGSLYTNIMEKLKFEPSLDDSNITVAIRGDGIVILNGKVKSYIEKCLAEEIVEKLRSVKGVANELEVHLLDIYKKDDADIVRTALDRLKLAYFIPHENIKISVAQGHLTLIGDVEYNYQKECAQSAVHDLYGVTFVTNNINIKSSVTPFKVKEEIIKEFERNARIDANNIQVEVNGNEITLKGNVKNFDEYKEAKTAAWSVPGISSVIDQLKISW